MEIKKIHIAHIITGLNTGGAEMMLYRLLKVCDRTKFYPVVISLSDSGDIGDKIKKLDVDILQCHMEKKYFKIFGIFNLIYFLIKYRINIVQTWMYHADFFGGIVGKVLCIPVVWGIHNTTLLKNKSKKTTIIIARLNAWLSKFVPASIICCSKSAQKVHGELGYDRNKICFIPNGFDYNMFKFDKNKRNEVRKNLHIKEDEFVIGMFARFDPQKDYKNLINAAFCFSQKVQKFRVLLCGTDINKDNKVLMKWISEKNLDDKFILLGQRSDVQELVQALDLFTLSSLFGEAFPLVVGEAMLSEIPTAVTDVGDSRDLVGDTGMTVPPGNYKLLADSWKIIYDMDQKKRRDMGNKARQRIIKNYAIQDIGKKYESLYESMLARLNVRE